MKTTFKRLMKAERRNRFALTTQSHCCLVRRLLFAICFLLLCLFHSAPVPAATSDWQLALPGWQYQFPRDHGAHPQFKTEWWYFTGNLRDDGGREFGFQLTWFRHGILAERDPALSRFVVRDLNFAHFTISDLHAGRFYFFQKTSRGAFGEAGVGAPPGRVAWIDDWQLFLRSGETWEITGSDDQRAVRLTLKPAKPPVIQGENGISQKAEGAGHASCYYSQTRLVTTGEIMLNGTRYQVTGESWFDHEWATNQLTPEQVGWDWFSVQVSDNSELMLYQMRRRDGSSDPNSSGTIVAPNGATTHLRREDFELTPLAWWKSPSTGARYPVRWRLRIPQIRLDVEVSAALENQELALESLAYWEGAIRIRGTRDTRPVSGHGYMELTGYSGALVGLEAPGATK